ncbi:choice-of-anchor D domain-containing protein, partial [bacterium]|nr:choice-of-anchor D domain-containing protein [bacterium]
MNYKKIKYILTVLILQFCVLHAEITEVGRCDTPGTAYDVFIQGDYAYIADFNSGLTVVDISDPENPEVAANFDDYENPSARGIFVVDDIAFVGSGYSLLSFDISDLDDISLLDNHNVSDYAYSLIVIGDIACVPCDGHGLCLVDVSNPRELRTISYCRMESSSLRLFVIENTVYVGQARAGLYIVDISDPENPQIIGSVDTPVYASGVYVSGDYCYVGDDEGGLQIIDVSDPEYPDIVGNCDFAGAGEVFIVDNFAFVLDYRDNVLAVVDVSDPEDPEIVESCDTEEIPRDIEVVDNYAYIANFGSGLLILDVSDYTITGPRIDLSIDELNFEDVGLDLSRELPLTIGNIGNEDLIISEMSIVGDYFSVDFEDELTIEPDAETDVAVTFTPEERREFEGTLTITSNDEENGVVEVALTGVGVGPVISIHPQELDFGIVGIDLTEELPLTIHNSGLNDLVISSITNETEFFTFQFDEEVTLEPDGRLEIPVTFSPVLGIDYEDTITITSNDPDNETVEVPLSGRGVGALIDTDPEIIDFGDVGLERSRDRQLTIRNEGQLDLHVLDIVVEDPYFGVQFEGEFVIEPDRSHNITVTFAPERSGEFEGSLIIGSDDRQNEEFIVPLAGTGVGPRIAVDQETMRFDMVRVDRSSAMMLTITAVGLTDLTVSDVSVDGDYFSHDFDGEVFIELNSRFQVMVTYSPTDDGIHEATLNIFSDDEINPQKTVVLTGSAIDGVISDTPGSALSVYVDGDFAYVADDEAGLRIIDIYNPEDLYEVGSYDSDGNCSGVVVVDNYAYVADGSGGMLVVDLSSPQEPELLAVVETPGEALNVDIAGDYVYIADGESGLRIINIYDPERPAEVGHCDTPGGARGVAVQGDFAYIADDIRGLRIINVSDPEEPEEVGSYNTEGWAWDVFVLGNIAYVADERYGLRIIDVSDPEHPSELGSYDTDENAYGVTIYGDYAYVADGEGGVCVIHIADPENPVLIDTYYAPDLVVDVFISGNYAYTAASESGLLVLDIIDYVSVDCETDPPLPTEFSLSVYPNPF